jgi:Zn-dependent alcohol dehydrogenase
VVGQVHSTAVPFNPSLLVLKHARLAGCLSASQEHYYRGLRFLERHAGRFRWDDMITSARPLEAINDAFERMRDWSEIKPALTFASRREAADMP